MSKYEFNSKQELMDFLASEVVNTTEAIEIIGCSRQNLNQLVKTGSLVPIRTSSRESLFLKSEILERKEKRRNI